MRRGWRLGESGLGGAAEGLDAPPEVGPSCGSVGWNPSPCSCLFDGKEKNRGLFDAGVQGRNEVVSEWQGG